MPTVATRMYHNAVELPMVNVVCSWLLVQRGCPVHGYACVAQLLYFGLLGRLLVCETGTPQPATWCVCCSVVGAGCVLVL